MVRSPYNLPVRGISCLLFCACRTCVRRLKAIEPLGIATDDLALIAFGDSGKGALDYLLRVRERTFVVRIIAAPQQTVGPGELDASLGPPDRRQT